MTINALEIDGITYVPFMAGLKHPKLSWLILMLNMYGIRHTVAGQALQGPMLYVEKGTVELASGIINQELAVFIARTDNYDDGPEVEIRITINDLPDSHEFFSAQLKGHAVTKIEEVAPIDVLDVIEVEGKVIEDVPVTTQTIVTEIREHLAAVAEEAQAEDEEDEDDWGFDEVSLEAEDEDAGGDPEASIESGPEHDKVTSKKKKKDKPMKQEANDPDFEDATAAAPINVPVTGTEFLDADKKLEFEDVEFPNVKNPIRMYDVSSSNISAIGAKITNDPLVVTMYIRFKTGASVYRYNPISTADWNSTLNEAVRRQSGIMEASVGSFYYHTIKVKAEDGTIKCQRLNDDDKWVEVQPKAARTKEIKERAKS